MVSTITLEKARELVDKYGMFYKQQEDDLNLFCYHYLKPKVYAEEPVSTELRGIVFNDNGDIVSRPYPRFHNFGSSLCDVDKDTEVTTTEKIDGHLFIGFTYNGEIRYSSKGSLHSWVVDRGTKIIDSRHKKLIQDKNDKSVMFELRDPENPVATPVEEFKLYLTGIRDLRSGDLYSPQDIVDVGREYGIDTPRITHRNTKVYDIIDAIKDREDMEGVVAYTDNGLFKIKCEWYLELHDIATMIENENKTLYFDDRLDGAYYDLPEHSRSKADELVNDCEVIINNTIEIVSHVFNNNQFETRKELALHVIEHYDSIKSIFFRVWDGISIESAVTEYYKHKWR